MKKHTIKKTYIYNKTNVYSSVLSAHKIKTLIKKNRETIQKKKNQSVVVKVHSTLTQEAP